MRMLDNVIDINYYAVKKARDSNLRHRPVGLGVMGFQDSLYRTAHSLRQPEAVEFADRSMEAICYYAYWASTELAQERGRYSSYKGSLWDQRHPAAGHAGSAGEARGGYVEVDRSATLDWDALRKKIATATACATRTAWPSRPRRPSPTSSGSTPRSSPLRQPVGQVQPVGRVHRGQRVPGARPQALGLWDDVMVMDLKHFDGSLRPIDRVPEDIKALYATAFEVEPNGW
jgi:ribonucleoside-diphosphate reductase alpha chain